MLLSVGDVVELRKEHPCGNRQWEITRTGADFRIKCLGCGHQVMIPRPKFEKSIKKVVKSQSYFKNLEEEKNED
jgi:hypothetical protein